MKSEGEREKDLFLISEEKVGDMVATYTQSES